MERDRWENRENAKEKVAVGRGWVVMAVPRPSQADA